MNEITEVSIRLTELDSAIAAIEAENKNSSRLPSLREDKSQLINRLYRLVQRLHRKDKLENELFYEPIVEESFFGESI